MTALLAAPAVAPAAPTVGAVRARVARRRLVVGAALTVLVIAAAVTAMSLGDYALSPEQVVRALLGGADRRDAYVVLQVRAPRVVTALLVGACLGVAGAILQALLRNGLASPDLLGISSGSAVGAVIALLVLGTTGPLLAVCAFVGGLVVAGVLLLAGRHRGDDGLRIVLAGVGFAFLGVAVTSFLLVRARVELAQAAFVWLIGSLSSTPWSDAAVLAGVAAASVPAVALCARWLPLLQLGRPTALSLGVPAGAVRVVAVLTAVVLTATTAAFAGPISFIALCAPAIARPLLGHGAVALGASGAVGAVLLLVSDLVAQHAFPGRSVPVGVVTGAVGALFLLWLLATSRARQL